MEFRDDLDWIDYNPKGFNRYAGPFFFARFAPGEYRMHLIPREEHLNQGGVVHGGVSMTLADNAMGIGAHYEDGRPASTIEFSGKFLAAAKFGAPLYGRAVVERRTRDVCFMAAELWNHGRKTFVASGVWKYVAPKGPQDGWAAGSPP